MKIHEVKSKLNELRDRVQLSQPHDHEEIQDIMAGLIEVVDQVVEHLAAVAWKLQ